MAKVLTPTIGELVTILGYDGTDFSALKVDADGHLQIDVLTAALASGAATAARQDTMITALQLIDDLRNALGSVNTDDLQVDVKTSALPSGAATAAKQQKVVNTTGQGYSTATHAAGDITINILTVPAGYLYELAFASMVYTTGTCSQMAAWLVHGADLYRFLDIYAPTISVAYTATFNIWMSAGNNIRMIWYGTSLNNTLRANTIANVYEA